MTNKQCIVGAVKVNKIFIHRNNNYEVAAWWEDQEANQGVFPLVLEREYNHPNQYLLVAKISATVIDDYFPALWGGMPVSREPYQCKNLGEERVIRQHIDIDRAIQSTGNSPGNDLDLFFHPDWWDVVEEEASNKLFDFTDYLSSCWNNYRNLSRSSFETASKYHFEYQSKLSSLSFTGQQISKWSKRLELISRCKGYHGLIPGERPIVSQEQYQANISWSNVVSVPSFNRSLVP